MEDLGGNVVRCAIHLMHVCVGLAIVMRSTKIDNFDCSAVVNINQNVLRFKVPMCHITAMAVSDSLQNLLSHDS